jgi:16S rRNA processing protein RimM
MIREEEVFKIGRIGKPHGIKGEVSIHINDDVFDRVDADYLVLMVDGILVPFFIVEYRFRTDETVLMKFDGIDTQEQARELTNCDVFFPFSLADTDDDALTWSRVVGMQLFDANTGKTVGTITGVDETTVNILLEVNTGKGDILVPAADELIADIDWQKREIHINIPEGLLNL